MSETKPCAQHPDRKAAWACEKCGQAACQTCIDESVDAFDPIATRCPSCRGRCYRLDQDRRAASVQDHQPDIPMPARRQIVSAQIARERLTFHGPWREEILAAFSYPIKGENWWLLMIGVLFYWMVDLILPYTMVLSLFFMAFFAGYFCSYMVKIVQASIMGERELPYWPDFYHDGIVRPLFIFLVPTIFALGPGYALKYGVGAPVLGYLLLAVGIFFFPMMLLAAIILNAPLAANPLLAVPAILRTRKPYLGVVAIFVVALTLFELARGVGSQVGSVGELLIRYAYFYAFALAMHVLGLFYGRFEKQIGWLQD